MKIKHIIAIIMTMVFIISLLGGSSAMATGAEAENEAADEELELLDTEKRTDLDETEIATAEDINVLVSSDYDVTDVKDGITYDEEKVSVTYYDKKSKFDISKPGKYDTYYKVEPFSKKKAYLIHRIVTVGEPEFSSGFDDNEATSEDTEETSEEEPDPLYTAVEETETATPGKAKEADGKDKKEKKEEDVKLVGEERKNEELPLSKGEIESIQSNTASFTIQLDSDQDISLIEEGIDPETGNEDSLGDESLGEESSSLDRDTTELSLNPVKLGSDSMLSKLGDFISQFAVGMIPSIESDAASSKDSMTVSYSGYAAYCGHRTGIKYISEDGDYKNHLVYCLDFNRDTTDGTVNTSGTKVKTQITFCLVNGARTLGGMCHTSKYSVDSASADYFITSAAIHILNGEVTLAYYNDGSNVYDKIALMVKDAKNLDKSKYNVETGLTKSITYTIAPKKSEWKEVSEGLYKSADKFVRTKTGTITDVKYSITGAPSDLKVGEINKDSSDIVAEDDLKKYDIAVAQTDKDKSSANFYLYANEEAMKKIIAGDLTIKVQAKAYSNEKGGRKWSPTVVSQQKVTFLESFTPVSAKATVKIVSKGKLGSFSFSKTDKFTKTPIPGATYYLYEDKDCDDLLCELEQNPNVPGLYGTGVETLTQSKYYLKEVDNPEGYEKDDTVYEIGIEYFTIYDAEGKVTQKPTKTFTHEEYPEPIGVVVTKKDAFTQEEIRTAGFAVFDDLACTKRTIIDAERNPKEVPIFKYNEDIGAAVSEKFMKTQDKYYVKEVTVPAGYINSGTVWTVTSGYGDVAQLSITNTPLRCSVDAVKKDKETGAAQGDAKLSGATYGLYAAEDIKYPDGSGVVTYRAKDPIKSTKGLEFKFNEIPAVKGALIATIKTDDKGEFDLKNLYYGNYFIKEIKESEGYILDNTVYDLKFKDIADNHKDLQLSRILPEVVKKQAFEIIKVSTDGDNAELDKVKGAEFTVKLKSDVDKNGWDKAKTYDTLVTDDKGYARSKELPYGTYLVKETKTPKELYKTDDFTVTISEDSRTPQSWRTLNDAPFKSYIRIVKKDAESGERILLSGVTFKIKKAGAEDFIEQKVGNKKVSEFVTDETGTATTPLKLKYGDYEVTEIKAPEGYLLTKDSLPFTVTKEGAVQVLEDEDGDPVIDIVMEDKPVKGSISLHKEGEVLTGTEYDTIVDRILTAVTGDNRSVKFKYDKASLAGAEYQLIAAEDIYTPDHQTDEEGVRRLAVYEDVPLKEGTVVATLTTDEEGRASIDNLPLGRYKVVESKAPEGFVLDEAAKDIELTYQDDHTEVVYKKCELTDERVKTSISLIKKNSVTENPVPGAVYGVFATVDILSRDGQVLISADSLIEQVKTDDEGKAVFEADLPLGRYYVSELEPAPGYLVDENQYEVDFTYQDPKIGLLTKELEISEVPIVVEVSKTDITTGKELIGAKLEILDKNNEVYADWTTDGNPYTLNAIPAGTYTLRETYAPNGYMIANEVEFTVEETSEIQKVTMSDERVKGIIEIYKTDADTKKALKGVTFEVRDSKGKVIEELKTNKKGFASSKELDIFTYKKSGECDKEITYYVVETKAADGYILSSKKHKVKFKYKDAPEEPLKKELKLTNKRKQIKKLPQTGGNYNPWLFMAFGSALIIGSVWMYLRKRRNSK